VIIFLFFCKMFTLGKVILTYLIMCYSYQEFRLKNAIKSFVPLQTRTQRTGPLLRDSYAVNKERASPSVNGGLYAANQRDRILKPSRKGKYRGKTRDRPHWSQSYSKFLILMRLSLQGWWLRWCYCCTQPKPYYLFQKKRQLFSWGCPCKAEGPAGSTVLLSQNLIIYAKKKGKQFSWGYPFKADGSTGSSHISGVCWLHPPLSLLRPAQGESCTFAAYNY
jgi:hypothetical protein